MFGKFEEYITCGAMRCSVNLVVFVCGAVQHADTVQHADAFLLSAPSLVEIYLASAIGWNKPG